MGALLRVLIQMPRRRKPRSLWAELTGAKPGPGRPRKPTYEIELANSHPDSEQFVEFLHKQGHVVKIGRSSSRSAILGITDPDETDDILIQLWDRYCDLSSSRGHHGRPGRPRKPDAMSSTERARRSKERRGVAAVELPGTVIDALDRICRRDGDASRAAAATRVILDASR